MGWGDQEYGPASQLEWIDIHDPANPIQLSVYPTEDTIHAVQVVDPYAYLAAGSDGVLVLDINAADAPTLQYRYPLFAQDVWLADDGYVYIAGGNNGVLVFEPIQKAFP